MLCMQRADELPCGLVCQLFAALNGNPADAERVSYVSSWTHHMSHFHRSAQHSKAFNLTKGQLVYLRVDHVEGVGEDHSTVGLLVRCVYACVQALVPG